MVRFLTLLAMLLIAAPTVRSQMSEPRLVQGDGEDPDTFVLPPGAMPAFALGRSLLQQGDAEGALPYLNRAYRFAPEVERIAAAYLQALVETGYLGDALTVAGELVDDHPQEPAYRRQYANLLARAGRFRLALQELRHLRDLGNVDLETVKLEAELYERLEQVDAARAVLEDARERFPGAEVELILSEAAVLRRAGRAGEQEQLLTDALASRPDSVPLRLACIQERVMRDDLPGAVVLAREGDERSVAEDAEAGPRFQLELAEFLGRQGRFDEAAAVLERLTEQGEAELDVQLRLVRLWLGLGRNEAALQMAPSIVTTWPESGEARYLWGQALAATAEPDSAAQRYREAVKLSPERADYRISLLQILVMHNRFAVSGGDLTPGQRALRDEVETQARLASTLVHERDATGHLILGYAFRALNDLRRAGHQFEAAAESRDVRLQALLELSFCWNDLGEFALARKTLENLHQEFPDEPEVANSFGYFLAERGVELARAEKLVLMALKIDADNGAYLDSLAWVRFQQGRFEDAFDLLVEAANARPDDPVILEHLGLTLRALGKDSEALDVLRRSLAAGGPRSRLQPVIEELELHDH